MVNNNLKKLQRSPRSYSESFKRLVVEEYEKGHLNKDQLQRKYDIRGNQCIQNWLRKYSKLAYPRYKSIGRPMKDNDQQRLKELESELKQEKKALEKRLREAEHQLSMYKKFVEIAERELNIEIRKKSGAKQFKK